MAIKQIVILERAENNIFKFADYISKQGYSDRAYSFVSEIYDFINTLNISAQSFSICRHSHIAKKKYKCIPYKMNYVIIFSVTDKFITIHNIVPAKKIR